MIIKNLKNLPFSMCYRGLIAHVTLTNVKPVIFMTDIILQKDCKHPDCQLKIMKITFWIPFSIIM